MIRHSPNSDNFLTKLRRSLRSETNIYVLVLRGTTIKTDEWTKLSGSIDVHWLQ